MQRPQVDHDVLRFQVSVNESVVVKFSQPSDDHREDLVKVTRLSVIHQIVSESHLVSRHGEGNMINSDLCTSERTEMNRLFLSRKLHD